MYDKGGTPRSRIVSTMTPGKHRHDAADRRHVRRHRVRDHQPEGEVGAERATALISIAHPDFRESLAREAREKNIIRRAIAS